MEGSPSPIRAHALNLAIFVVMTDISTESVRWTNANSGVIVLRGSDAERFLNGMVTNDVTKIEIGHAAPGLLLDRKGHVLALLDVLRTEDAFVLVSSGGTGTQVAEVLEKHIIADDVDVEDRSSIWSECVFDGPDIRASLEATSLPVPAPGEIVFENDCIYWGALQPTGVPVHVIGLANEVQALAAAGIRDLEEEEIAELHVVSGWPRLGIDVGERNFPQEAGLDYAVSQTKGCYIGQEIVARIYARGGVKKKLVQLEAKSKLAADVAVEFEGSNIGQITSASKQRALAYIKLGQAVVGTIVKVGVHDAQVVGIVGAASSRS